MLKGYLRETKTKRSGRPEYNDWKHSVVLRDSMKTWEWFSSDWQLYGNNSRVQCFHVVRVDLRLRISSENLLPHPFDPGTLGSSQSHRLSPFSTYWTLLWSFDFYKQKGVCPKTITSFCNTSKLFISVDSHSDYGSVPSTHLDTNVSFLRLWDRRHYVIVREFFYSGKDSTSTYGVLHFEWRLSIHTNLLII